MTKSQKLYEQAVNYIPGGVNSPVRAFLSVNDFPRFIERADKCYIFDADGNKYIDYVCSWGPMILGHNNKDILKSILNSAEKGLSFGAATEKELEMAQLICNLIPSIDMVRMVNSGTEAVMSAIRLARGYTGKNKIIKFDGCYHGHSDSMLVKAGSGVMTGSIAGSLGVTENCIKDTLSAVYNDIESVYKMFEKYKNDIAAVIIEPVAANMGVVLPENNFLNKIRNICTENKALLIFDEVITGFRLGIDGAQGYFNIKPDLTTFGKIIGAGMPVGAFGGKKEIMEMIAPCGGVYQAGTLSGNPIAMSAGITQLKILRDNPEIYKNINENSLKLFKGIENIIKQTKSKCTINYIGSIGSLFFTDNKVENYNTALISDTKKYADYFKYMLQNNIYIAPSQFEAMFVSKEHNEEIIDLTLKHIEEALIKIKKL